MKPELQKFADANAWHVRVGTVNVDTDHHLATRYQVSAIPKLVVFRDGKVSDEAIGMKNKSELSEIMFGK